MSNIETREGFAIVDGRGRPWDRHLYPSREAAEATAAVCLAGAYSIKPAKEVVHFRPSGSTAARIVSDFVVLD